MGISWSRSKVLGGTNQYIRLSDSISSDYYDEQIKEYSTDYYKQYRKVRGKVVFRSNLAECIISSEEVEKGSSLSFFLDCKLSSLKNIIAERDLDINLSVSLHQLEAFIYGYSYYDHDAKIEIRVGDDWYNMHPKRDYIYIMNEILDAPFANFPITATFVGDKVNLSWSKVMQRLIATKYEIECSYDNKSYQNIQTIYGNNNLSFVHKNIPVGSKKVRYRIRQHNESHNLNGSWQYSSEINLNQAPIISLTDNNMQLGTVSSEFEKTYSVTDADNDTVTVTEKLDNKVKKTETITLGEQRVISITRDEWIRLVNGNHKLVIEVTDSKGAKSTAEYNFTKNENKIIVELKGIADCDERPTRILVTPTWQKEGAVVKVEACNNMNDEAPTWEDITDRVLINKPSFLSNETKTAKKWKIGIRVTITKNKGYNQEISLSSIGGAYE